MKLTKKELQIIRILSKEEKNIKELASLISSPKSYVSNIIKALAEKGFVSFKKRGLAKFISISEAKHAVLLKRIMIENEYMKFENILSGQVLEIISFFPGRRKEILKNSGVSQMTLQAVLKNISQYGIIKKENSLYKITDKTIKEFVSEFRKYENQKIAEKFSKDSIILWQKNKEFLIKAYKTKEEDNFLLTGLSTFHKYGISLTLLDFNYFFYSPYKKKLKKEDAILHSLALYPFDAKTILFNMLLWFKNKKKIDINYILRESEKYELEETINGLMDYFKTKGKKRLKYFPKYEEFEIKARDYGLL